MYGVRAAIAASSTAQVSFHWKGPAQCTTKSTPCAASARLMQWSDKAGS